MTQRFKDVLGTALMIVGGLTVALIAMIACPFLILAVIPVAFIALGVLIGRSIKR